MNKQVIAEVLSRAASALNSVSVPRSEEPQYHLLAGAIVWDDELPDWLTADTENCLRLILRYRTTLILELPEDKWKPYWDLGRRLFPGWVGFRPERCTPSEKLKEFYKDHTRRAMLDMHEEG